MGLIFKAIEAIWIWNNYKGNVKKTVLLIVPVKITSKCLKMRLNNMLSGLNYMKKEKLSMLCGAKYKESVKL